MKYLRHHLFWVWCGALLVFLVFMTGVLTHANWISRFDSQIASLIRGTATPQLTLLIIHFTKLVNVLPVIAFTLGMTLILILFRKSRAAFFLLINSLGLAGPVNTLFKYLINRPRPTFHHLVSVHSTSFPSGHSMSAMMLGGSLIIIGNHFLKSQSRRFIFDLLVGCLILLVGLSRIYVGVHFASDVVGGWSLGLSLLLSSRFIFEKFLGGTA